MIPDVVPVPGTLAPRLLDWMEAPQNRIAFRRVRELIPTARIDRGGRPPWLPPGTGAGASPGPALAQARIEGSLGTDGPARTLSELLDASHTDALVVLHRGALVHEEYRGGMSDRSTHLAMSVSKSITATAVGAVIDDGLLDPDAAVTDVLGEYAGTGLDGATVRQVLDMRTGTAEQITTLEQQRAYYATIGWAPADENTVGDTDSRDHFARFTRVRPHGGPFEYRSTLTCLLGMIAERAGGRRLPELISTRLWQPLGAEYDADLTVDRSGNAICDIGFCCTTRDLARVGEMLRLDGRRPGSAGSPATPVLSAQWVADTLTPEPDSTDAFGEIGAFYLPGPQAYYRNQWWVLRPRRDGRDGCYAALGIHGQMLLIDEATELVVAKFSSWPLPWIAEIANGTIDGLQSLGRQLAAP